MSGHVGLRDHLIGIGHTKINDPARPPRFHSWRRGLSQIENRVQIPIEHLLPPRHRFVKQIHPMIRPGAVDQGVDLTPFLFDTANELLGCNRIRHVTAYGQCLAAPLDDGSGRGLGVGLTGSVAEGDLPVLRGQVERNSASDSFGPSGDQRDVRTHDFLSVRARSRVASSCNVPAVLAENDCSCFGFLPSSWLASISIFKSSIVSTSRHSGRTPTLRPSIAAFSLVRARTRSVDHGISRKSGGATFLSPIKQHPPARAGPTTTSYRSNS